MIGLVWRAALSRQNQQFSRGRIHEGLDLIGGEVVFVCTNVRVCVHASDLGRADCASPSLPGPTPQSLSEMKDDGGTEAERQRRTLASPFFYERKHAPNLRKQKAAIYNTAALICTYFCYRIWALNCSTEQSEREREREETKSEGLISRKSFIQLLMTQVTCSKQIVWRVGDKTSTGCVCRVCVCVCVFSLYLTQAVRKVIKQQTKSGVLQISHERKALWFKPQSF